jgi:sugar lactone lactonase YvrE
VIESFLGRVRHVPILADGSAGPATTLVDGLYGVLDGLALGPDGTLYISCYEPGRIYRRTPDGRVDILIEDNQAVLLAHPTNVALKGNKLYTANLGRWHITEIDLSALPA